MFHVEHARRSYKKSLTAKIVKRSTCRIFARRAFFVIAELLTHIHGERSHANVRSGPPVSRRLEMNKMRRILFIDRMAGSECVIASRLDIKKGRTTEVELPLELSH